MSPTQYHLAHPKYRPDIDGLRAIAVLSVVGYHYFAGVVPGGFIGVDVFFVISGFLISTIILGNLDNNRFRYSEFYARRIKRIFPALLLVLFFSLVFGWYVHFPDEYSQLGKHVAGGAGFVSNFVLWSESGYFDRAAETKPLLHLWSLGIEEQFYIFWPLLLGIFWRMRLSFLFIAILVATLSFAVNIYWIGRDPEALFYSPFSRAWELMIGGLLAYIFLQWRDQLDRISKLLPLLAPIGLVLIVIGMFCFSKYTPFPGWWALIPTIGSALVIVGHPTGWVNRYLLSHPAMVWIGLISYPLYLWHWPLLAYARILNRGLPDRTIRIALVLVSILLASATYILVEKRFKRGYSKRDISILAYSMILLFVIGVISWKGALAPRLNSKSVEVVIEAANDWDFPGSFLKVSEELVNVHTAIGGRATTLFLGDSHVQQYGPRINRVLKEDPSQNTAVFITQTNCPPIPKVNNRNSNRCSNAMTRVREYLTKSEVKVVVIGGAWNRYFISATKKSSPNSFYYLDDTGKKAMFNGGEGALLAMQELESFIRMLSSDRTVFLLLDNPQADEFSPYFYLKGSRLTRIESELPAAGESFVTYNPDQRQLRDEMKAMAIRSGAETIDPSLMLCESRKCRVTTTTGKLIFKDTAHFRPFYVENFADYIDVTLRQ